MATFVMLTRIAPGAVGSPGDLEKLELTLMDHIRKECPNVRWVKNYAVMGPWDYVDVFEAPDTDTAMRVNALVHTHGRARAETWPAEEWGRFKGMIHGMP